MVKPSFAIRVEGNLVVLTTTGSQTSESITAIRKDVDAVLESSSGRKDMLVIATGAGIPKKSVLNQAVEGMLTLPIRRLAVVGTVPDRVGAARHVVKAAEDPERFKVFRLEEDARAWLEEKS